MKSIPKMSKKTKISKRHKNSANILSKLVIISWYESNVRFKYTKLRMNRYNLRCKWRRVILPHLVTSKYLNALWAILRRFGPNIFWKSCSHRNEFSDDTLEIINLLSTLQVARSAVSGITVVISVRALYDHNSVQMAAFDPSSKRLTSSSCSTFKWNSNTLWLAGDDDGIWFKCRNSNACWLNICEFLIKNDIQSSYRWINLIFDWYLFSLLTF